MKDTIEDALAVETTVQEQVVAKKKSKAKPKVFKESALAAGLQALELLESSDTATKPVVITAKDIVAEGIESIHRLRLKGVPLLRIYNDLKKAVGLRIGFPTFAGYVCEISKEKGLALEKPKKEATPAARHQPRPEPAVAAVEASPENGWACVECKNGKAMMLGEKKLYECQKCGIAYAADQDGNITTQRFSGE